MKLPRWATALDVVAVLMALVAISVAIGGGFRIWIFDSRLSVTAWWRPALFERSRDRDPARARPATAASSTRRRRRRQLVARARHQGGVADPPGDAFRRAARRFSRRHPDRLSAGSDEPLEDLFERLPRSARPMGHRLVSDDRHRGLSYTSRTPRRTISRTSRSSRRSRCRCAISRSSSGVSRCGPAWRFRSSRSTSRSSISCACARPA